jgi:glutamate 5-kinase
VSSSLLVLLTDTSGLYSSDPRTDGGAELLKAVAHTDPILDQVAKGGSGPLGSGGVATKVTAARMAGWSGIPTVIAPAHEVGVALQAALGADVGTWVAPNSSALSARKLWLAFGLRPVGQLSIDDGAVVALSQQNRSLLAVGVTGIDGRFESGAAVEVVDAAGVLVARGRSKMSSDQISEAVDRVSDVPGDGEVIHRDDLVVLV